MDSNETVILNFNRSICIAMFVFIQKETRHPQGPVMSNKRDSIRNFAMAPNSYKSWFRSKHWPPNKHRVLSDDHSAANSACYLNSPQ